MDSFNNLRIPYYGKEMFQLMEKLYPICRSITGNGVRKTFDILNKSIDLKIYEIPSGTKVYDWIIPKEWNIKDAYIKDSKGNKIIDFNESNLHVMNYSIPINRKISLKELKEHLYTLPEYPDWIPYKTSYYQENWGFCLSYNNYKMLKDDIYEVNIDSTLEDGFLTYGEFFLKGKSKDEVLFSTYICHPSLCNDNLSGIVLLTFILKHISNLNLNYSYRFLFIPETIGSITWLSINRKKIKNIKYGLVATCVGDSSKKMFYKKSRDNSNRINTIVKKVLNDSETNFEISDFNIDGSDERQYCSPGFNLPIGSLMRTPYIRYKEYHTSADNMDLIQEKNLQDSLEKYLNVIYVLENDKKYLNLNPKCEPMLSRRGLFRAIGGSQNLSDIENALFWVLNFSDGSHSLLDISIRAKLKFNYIKEAADLLFNSGLLKNIK